jgi:hypothetical protein
MALNANALTTVARLSDFLGIDAPVSGSASERAMEIKINAISNTIERYTGKTFKKQEFSEEYSLERGQSLQLNHYPVDLTANFTLQRRNSQMNESQWETIDQEYYSIDADAGIIQNMAGILFFRGRNLYRVIYTAGYDFDNSSTFLGDTDAGDVELAAWLMLQDMINSVGVNQSIKQERIGDYSITYNVQNGSGGGMRIMNPQAQDILDTYADLDVGGVLTPLQTV